MSKVVYVHRRLDDDTVFYVGIGKKDRPYCDRKRNSIWNKIVRKHGFRVEVLFEGLTDDQAKNAERWLISLHGRLDIETGRLANMTDGGDGVNNCVRREEWRRRISEALKGKPKSDDHIRKMAEKKKGVKQSPETIEKRRQAAIGRKMSDEFKEKARLSKLGSKNPSARKVIDTSTGIIYGSIVELCNLFGFKYKTTYRMISGEIVNKTTFQYYNN